MATPPIKPLTRREVEQMIERLDQEATRLIQLQDSFVRQTADGVVTENSRPEVVDAIALRRKVYDGGGRTPR